MKLKIGDIVTEDDGIIILKYEIISVRKKEAIGVTVFENEKYYTSYLSRYTDKENIRKPNQSPTDLTRIYLSKEK